MENKYMTAENIQYLMKHAKKVNEIMRKSAFPYSREKFVDLNRITFTIEESNDYLGTFKDLGNFKYEIAINADYFKSKYKRKYNQRLLSTLAHEFIHLFTNIWFTDDWYVNEKFELMDSGACYESDSSPIFCALVSWFQINTNLEIKMNGNLSYTFMGRDYFNLSEIKTFMEYIRDLFKLKKKLEYWIKELFIKLDKNTVINFNKNNLSYTVITPVKRVISDIEIVIYNIELGMDELFDTELILEYINDYEMSA